MIETKFATDWVDVEKQTKFYDIKQRLNCVSFEIAVCAYNYFDRQLTSAKFIQIGSAHIIKRKQCTFFPMDKNNKQILNWKEWRKCLGALF